jgi:hypothetical protein
LEPKSISCSSLDWKMLPPVTGGMFDERHRSTYTVIKRVRRSSYHDHHPQT